MTVGFQTYDELYEGIGDICPMQEMTIKTMKLREIFSELGGLSSAIMFVTLVPLSTYLFDRFMET